MTLLSYAVLGFAGGVAAYVFGWAAERLPRILSALRGQPQPLIVENAL